MTDISLNETQIKAVTYPDEPLIIVAGAGTGKTRVITERIVWLINQGKAKPEEILALTFTEKAANEMQERIDIALPLGYADVWVSTFHAFADRILKQDSIHIGLNPNYKLMNQSGSYFFLLQRLFELELEYFRPLSDPTKFVGAMLKHFSRLQDEDISPDDYKVFAQKADKEKYPHIKELSDAYTQYMQSKIKESVFDFGDLISTTIRLFRERPNVLSDWRKRFKYILIDEFQDTNYAQYELIKLLALDSSKEKAGFKAPIITVVADDDQSIYRFRGAAVSNVLQFKEDFPSAGLLVLTENYRSNQEVLDKSYDVIQYNNPDRLEIKEKIVKKLNAAAKGESDGNAVQFEYFFKAYDEAEWISDKILELIKSPKEAKEAEDLPLFSQHNDSEEKLNFSDFAVLVRAHDHSEEIVQTFKQKGIPYQFSGVRKLFLRQEVKDMINILRALMDYKNDVPMFGIISFDIFDIPAQELIEINRLARELNEHIYNIVDSVADANPAINLRVSEKTKEHFKKINELFKQSWELIKDGANSGEVLLNFIKESGYLAALTGKIEDENGDIVVRKNKELENEVKVQNLAKFFEFIKDFQKISSEEMGVSNLNKFVDYIELVANLGDSPQSDVDVPDFNAVHIITVHASKGLEFPVVFLPNLVQGRFPSVNRTDTLPIPEEMIKEILPEGDEHLEEERRLYYVGMTRAQDKLFLTASQHYGEGKRRNKISPFVVETFGEEEIGNKLENPIQYGKEIFDFDNKKQEMSVEDIMPVKPINFLSYSQVQTYETCPKKYKYRYILKVPTPQNATLMYGSIVHATLKAFYDLIKKNQQGFEGFGSKPSVDDLKNIFTEKWEAMARIGAFKSRTYKDKMFQRGLTTLEEFYNKLYSDNQRPFLLEQPFKLKIGKYTIAGIIDRVDYANVDGIMPTGEVGVKRPIVDIIDYKTGKTREQKEVDKDLQLAIYALAAKEVFKIEPRSLSLMFVDQGLKVETDQEKMQKLEEKIKDQVITIGDKINSGDYRATPGFLCKYCEFRDICEDAIL